MQKESQSNGNGATAGTTRTATSRLSEAQRAVWTYCHVHHGTTAYHICMRFGPFPDIDISRLKAATELALDNHPIVKARLKTDNEGEPTMERHDDEPSMVETVIASDSEENDILNRFCVPLDYDGGRLYRLLILKTERGTSLLANFHHTIFDGISMNILLNDISAAYEGKPILPETDDLFDIARKERERRKTADYEAARLWHAQTFPKTTIRTMPPADVYDADSAMPSMERLRTGITISQWNDICNKAGQSGNIVSLTAFALFLGCFTGESEVRFSTVFHGRHGKSMQRTVGMLVQTIPVSAQWNGKTRLTDLMHDIRWQQARCMLNDIHPFSEVRKECGGFGNVNFIYQGNTAPQQHFCGNPMKKEFIMPNMSGSALAVEMWFEDGFLDLYAEYDAAIYSRETVVGMMKCLERMILCMGTARRVADISLADDAMLARLDGFNDTGKTASTGQNITEQFRHWAKTKPNAIAVIDGKRMISYGQLNRITDHMAATLRNIGVERGDVVALLMPRDASMVVATLGVLKCGAAYLPCSLDVPAKITAKQLIDADIILPITTNSILGEIGLLGGFKMTIDIDLLLKNDDEEIYETETNISQDDLLALFYTSGSTGKQKAVRITHGNVSAYCDWYHKYFQPKEGTVIGAYNTFTFDASITDMFTTLLSGATLAIVPEEIKNDIRAVGEYVNEWGIEIIDMPTQIGRLFAMHESCPSLRHIVLGGEALTPFKPCRDYNIYNQYGPTETTVAVTIHRMEDDEKCVPIGKAISGVRLYVVDSCGRRVPIGAPGELWIAGNQVAEGYHKRKTESAKRFTKNPFCTEKPFDRVFRTGDIVRYRGDGSLEFLGRKDGMVKIRGFRVELSAVEAALRKCSGVEEAAATTFVNSDGTQEIAAFLVSQKALDISTVRQEMLQRVTAEMVPIAMQQIESLPLTTSGKVDRRALPMPEFTADDDYTAPQNDREREICEVFAHVLGLERVSADADFFILGGTSITAVHVVMQLEKHGIKVEYADIYSHPTAQRLAKWIASDKQVETDDSDIDELAALLSAVAKSNNECLESLETVPLHDVLLTGATGFLGIHILAVLLARNINNVWCLVRRVNGMSGHDRLFAALHHYFGTKHDKRFEEKVQTIEGDMTMAATFHRLEGIESRDLTVINCAAMVKHFAPKELMERINVDAVNLLADYCMHHNARLIHISTLNAMMPADDGVFSESQAITESTFTPLHSSANPYTVTKRKAENMLLKAVERGLNCKIMRMGNLSSRLSDGMLQKGFQHNAAINWLRILAVTGCCPQSLMDAPVEFTPVDVAASAVMSLAETFGSGNVFHVFCPPMLSVGDVVRAMNRCGMNVVTASDEVFAQRLQTLQDNERDGQALAVARETRSFGTPLFCWNNDFTLKVLANHAQSMPNLPPHYIENLIKELSNNSFFNPQSPS